MSVDAGKAGFNILVIHEITQHWLLGKGQMYLNYFLVSCFQYTWYLDQILLKEQSSHVTHLSKKSLTEEKINKMSSSSTPCAIVCYNTVIFRFFYIDKGEKGGYSTLVVEFVAIWWLTSYLRGEILIIQYETRNTNLLVIQQLLSVTLIKQLQLFVILLLGFQFCNSSNSFNVKTYL